MLDVDDLRRTVPHVEEAGSAGYRRSTNPRNASGQQRPGAVVMATDDSEVAATVSWAVDHNHPIVVQATGHGFGGTVGEDTILIDTSGLNTVQIDGRAARVGAGARWQAVNEAAAARGLLGLSGTAPDVGVAGYTFHGGIGWLTRAYGLASGHLRAVEFVDGTGRPRRCDDQQDPEALWAFRGGGGLGVATALEFDLVPVGDLHAGFLLWPAAQAEQVVAAWAQVVDRLPVSLTSDLGLLVAPDAPIVAEPLRGHRVVHLSLACCAGAGAADALFDALAAAPAPRQNTFGPCDVERLGTIHLDPPAAVPALGQGLWLDEHTPEHAYDIVASLGLADDVPLPEIELRHVAVDPVTASSAPIGAMTRPPAPFVLHATGEVAHPNDRPTVERALRTVTHAARPASIGLEDAAFRDGQTDAVALADSADAARLAAATAEVDPHGVFHRVRRLRNDRPDASPRSPGASPGY